MTAGIKQLTYKARYPFEFLAELVIFWGALFYYPLYRWRLPPPLPSGSVTLKKKKIELGWPRDRTKHRQSMELNTVPTGRVVFYSILDPPPKWYHLYDTWDPSLVSGHDIFLFSVYSSRHPYRCRVHWIGGYTIYWSMERHEVVLKSIKCYRRTIFDVKPAEPMGFQPATPLTPGEKIMTDTLPDAQFILEYEQNGQGSSVC